MQRYRTLSSYLRGRFGRRIQKVPLDAGFTCPNRDGNLSTRGCVFCNPRGSGSGLGIQGLTIAEQWAHWTGRFERKFKNPGYMAYLQSFSNTYGPLFRLERALSEIVHLSGLCALAIGTRPDCLDEAKLDLLAEQPVEEIWLELGLQSSSEKTLTRINRGHGFDIFREMTEAAAGRGLRVCAHVIAGLPGEGEREFLNTVEAVSSLPVSGIKFHNLYVCDGSTLADQWRAGEYTPLAREAYVSMLGTALTLLRPDIIVQRLSGDAAPGELLAPDWAGDKRAVLNAVAQEFESRDILQGIALLPKDLPHETVSEALSKARTGDQQDELTPLLTQRLQDAARLAWT